MFGSSCIYLFAMKKVVFLSIVLLLNTLFIFAQSEKKNAVYIVAAPNTVIYETRSGVDGGPIYSGKNGCAIGLEYSRELFKNFEIVLGAHYAWNKVSSESTMSSGPEFPITKSSFRINYVSVPIQIKYNLGNYFFVNGGTILNFDNIEKYNTMKREFESTIHAQFGLIVGIGAKLDFKNNYCFFINPYFQTNDLSSGRYENFYNLGAKVGLGYKF